MRADRLVALLMLLQTRGRITAREAAAELEVSERTARRDLEALGMAGVPIYSRQGRGGGWELIGGARTDLSGLTSNEARALFLVAGPSAAATPPVRAALRKLVRALPEPFRADAEAASGAVLVDPVGWDRAAARPPPPHLDAVQHAVIAGEQLRLGYVDRAGSATTRTVHPLGLATKGASWYLVAGTDAGQRTFRVDRITSVEPTGEPVLRPPGFDLEEAWHAITTEVDRRRNPVTAHGWADPGVIRVLRMALGTRLRIGPSGPDDRVEIEITGASEPAIAGELGGFGGAVELTGPEGVRRELARIAAELTALYLTDTGIRGPDTKPSGAPSMG